MSAPTDPRHVRLTAARGRRIRKFTGDPDARYVAILRARGWSVTATSEVTS